LNEATHKTKSLREKQAITWNTRLAISEYTRRRMTFGRYLGVQIKDLPQNYIEWGILNLPKEWAEYFAREWQRRQRTRNE
jgi:hypothetical protein